MKKPLSLLLALALCLTLTSPLAQAAQPTIKASPVAIKERLPEELALTDPGTRSPAAFPITQDVVTIDGGIFIITTNGITAEFQLPFGWQGFTQDIKLQLLDYVNTFDDPRSTVQYLIDRGINLLVNDPASGAIILVFVQRTPLSQLFISLEDEEMFQSALDMYQADSPEGFKREGANMEGLNFIRSLEPDGEDQLLVYFTYHEGAMIGFQMWLDGEEATPDEELLLSSVIAGTTLQ